MRNTKDTKANWGPHKFFVCFVCFVLALIAVSGAQEAGAVLGPGEQGMDEVVRFYADDPQRAFMGVVIVARGTDVLFAKGYGMANLEWSVPNTPTTKFYLGSISKQFTAAAILLLEERGKLRVTDLIKSYFPEAPATWDAITFHHLLSHTSGMTPGTPVGPAAALAARPEKTLERFRNVPLQSAPGTKHSYSNAGYQLLAYLIERISGQRYEDFLRESIFQPLGMNDSGSGSHPPIITSLASGYIQVPGAGGPSSNGRALLNAPFLDMSNGMGAGSLYSTVGDLHRWTQALFGGKLLSAASLTKMTMPVDSEYAYGLGVHHREGRRQISHGGSVPGFAGSLTYYPESQMTIAVLTNSRSRENPSVRPGIVSPQDELRSAAVVLAGWLGTLAHGGTVTLPARKE